MNPADITFSQKSVAETFTDGTLLVKVVHQLVIGTLNAGDIPPIRVVKLNDRWVTLDNRRLRVFKNAGTRDIPVIICDKNDPQIESELDYKKSSKSFQGGGIVRSQAPPPQRTFDNGIWIFNKKVLNWNIAQINQSMAPKDRLIPSIFPEIYVYYNCFLPWIIEETRATILNGLEATRREGDTFKLALNKIRPANNPENPTEMQLSYITSPGERVKAGDILLIRFLRNPKIRMFALASYLGESQNLLLLKVVIDQDFEYSEETAFEEGSVWQARILGSLTTLQRMYEACVLLVSERETKLEQVIRSANPELNLYNESVMNLEDELLRSLNDSQLESVQKVLTLKEGIALIEGPPGTGKTTTTIGLIRALMCRGERVLVCAPSNKAVQVLAERLLKLEPDVAAALVGVEEKLSDESPLRAIFISTWGSQKLETLKELDRSLSTISLEVLYKIPGRKLVCQEHLSELLNQFASLVKEIQRYKLSQFSDLEREKTELETAISSYISWIDSLSAQTLRSIEHFELNKKDPNISEPPALDQSRVHINRLRGVLLGVQATLQSLMAGEGRGPLDLMLMNQANVLFMTLSISGQQWLKEMKTPTTLIVDEAGQASEAETIIPLRLRPKKMILIGDVKQLPATTLSKEAEKNGFGRSLMQRLIEQKHPTSMLTIQYRMHPEIRKWPSKTFYGESLTDHSSVERPTLLGNRFPFLEPYSLIHVKGKETTSEMSRSYVNIKEANRVVEILTFLDMQIDLEKQVGVITFYKGQADHIRSITKQYFGAVQVSTVDAFQGDEKDVIVISCVRSNLANRIGFLSEMRRLNVALTRARQSLVILGDVDTLAQSDLAGLVDDAKARNVLFQEEILSQLSVPKVEQKKYVPEPKTTSTYSTQLYKTELCRHFVIGRPGSCRNGDRCSFAHGKHDLRG